MGATNWSSFSKELIVDGYSEAFHYPFVDFSNALVNRFYMGYLGYKDNLSVQVSTSGVIPETLKHANLFYN